MTSPFHSSILIYQLTFIYQFSFINTATRPMLNEKLMANGKWLMVNAAPKGGA